MGKILNTTREATSRAHMMRIVAIISSVILLSGLILMVKTDFGEFRTNTNKTGYIQSPNYPNVKGRKENCSWKLKSHNNGKNYVLRFSILNHKLSYTADSRKRECAAQLTVNRKPVTCTANLDFSNTNANCTLYYNSPACENTVHKFTVNPKPSCKSFLTNKQSPFSIEVTYVSDGYQNFEGPLTGFKASYRFIECKHGPITSTTSVAFAITTSDKTGTSAVSSQSKVSIIVATSVTGILLLALVIIAVICMRRRTQRNASQALPIREERLTSIHQSQNPAFSFTDDSNQSQANNREIEPINYEEVDVATGINQLEQATCGHVTNNAQSEGVIYSAVNVQATKKTVHYRKETVENVLYGTKE